MKKSALAFAAMALAAPLAASMRAFDYEMPSFSGSASVAKAQIEKDGLGRRVKPKTHPSHNAKRRVWPSDFAKFKAKVEATHSFNADPRDDKYLHSHARQMRVLKRALAA